MLHTLKEARWFVQRLLETREQMNIEFFVLVDVFADPVEDNHLNKPLNNQRLR